MEYQEKREDLPEKIEITFEIDKQNHFLKFVDSDYANLTIGEIKSFRLIKDEITFRENITYKLFEEDNFLEEKTGRHLVKLLYQSKE